MAIKININKDKLQDRKGSISGFEHLSDSVMQKHSKNIFQSIEKWQNIGFPPLGYTKHFISKRSFNSISLIKLLNEKHSIKEIYVVAYSVTELSGLELIKVANENNITLNILVSNLRNTAYQKKEIAIKNFEEAENVNIKYAGSHAKIFLVKTETDFLCIQSSANLGSNSRIEQYVIDNDEDVYNFHKTWLTEIFNDEAK